MESDSISDNGRKICEECYLEGHHKIKFTDPVAVRSKKLFRKQHGLSGVEGLTELQKEIYYFIQTEGGAAPEKIETLFGLTPRKRETNMQY